MVLGGSTNAVLHLIAIARAINIDVKLGDFQRISDTTPLLADLKPSGRYLMEDLHNAGGMPLVDERAFMGTASYIRLSYGDWSDLGENLSSYLNDNPMI